MQCGKVVRGGEHAGSLLAPVPFRLWLTTVLPFSRRGQRGWLPPVQDEEPPFVKAKDTAKTRRANLTIDTTPTQHRHDANPPTKQAPRPPQGPPHRAPRLRSVSVSVSCHLRHGCLRQACLRQACLRHGCLRDACHTSIVSSHVVSARMKRAAPLAPRRLRPACLPAQSAATPRPSDSSNLPPCATFATLSDSAPTPSVLRSRRPTHTACHISPATRGEASQSFPAPPMLRRKTSQTLNYQSRRQAFKKHGCPVRIARCPSRPCLHLRPRLPLRLIVPSTYLAQSKPVGAHVALRPPACCFSLSQLCMDALTSVGMLCWQSMMLHHSGCRAAKLGQAMPVRSALHMALKPLLP